MNKEVSDALTGAFVGFVLRGAIAVLYISLIPMSKDNSDKFLVEFIKSCAVARTLSFRKLSETAMRIFFVIAKCVGFTWASTAVINNVLERVFGESQYTKMTAFGTAVAITAGAANYF